MLSFPSPGDLPDPGIEPRSPALEANALTSEPPGKPKLYLRSFVGQAFVGKVMSLLLNILSRLVIAFLPKSKRLLIS